MAQKAVPITTSYLATFMACLWPQSRALADVVKKPNKATQLLRLALAALLLQWACQCVPWVMAADRLSGVLQLGILGPLSSNLLQLAVSTSSTQHLYRLQFAEAASACLIWSANQWLGMSSAGMWTLTALCIAAIAQLQIQLASSSPPPILKASVIRTAQQEQIRSALRAGNKPTGPVSGKKGPRKAASFAHPKATNAKPLAGPTAEVIWKVSPVLGRTIQLTKTVHTIACCLVGIGLASTRSLPFSELITPASITGLLQLTAQVVLLYCIFQQSTSDGVSDLAAAISNKVATGGKQSADLTSPTVSTDAIRAAGSLSSRASIGSVAQKPQATAESLKRRVSIQASFLPSVFSGASSGGALSPSARSSSGLHQPLSPAGGRAQLANALVCAETPDSAMLDAMKQQVEALQQSLLDIQEEQHQYELEWTSILAAALGRRKSVIGNRISMAGAASGSTRNVKEEAMAAHRDLLAWKADTEAKLRHLHDLTHELAHPVQGVLALSDTLVQGKHGDLSQAARDQLGMVRACAHHSVNMMGIYQDILDNIYRKTRGRSMQFDPCQLLPEVNKAMDRLGPMAGKRLILTTNVAKQHAALADSKLLYRALHVLLANAIKYARTGKVEVYSELSADREHVSLCVKDTGPGFSPEQLRQYSSQDASNTSGLDARFIKFGMGLLMVQHIMGLLCGELQISNNTPTGDENDAAGACVRLIFRSISIVPSESLCGIPMEGSQNGSSQHGSIKTEEDSSCNGAAAPRRRRLLSSNPPGARTAPMREKPMPAVPESSPVSVADAIAMAAKHMVEPDADGPAGQGGIFAIEELEDASKATGLIKGAALGTGSDDMPTILIVEDDPNNLTLLEEMMCNAGYNCLTANDGATAIMSFMSAGPSIQLVLMEADLPDMKGMDVCEKMRSLCPGRPPPIVILAGISDKGDLVEGLKRGASDWITKPFKPAELLARLENQLRMHHGDLQQLHDAAERNMLLLNQVLPPHVLDSLKDGNRVLVEKFPDVCVLHAEVIGASSLVSSANSADCVFTLNQMFSIFDQLVDKFEVHKVDSVGFTYCVAVGFKPQDHASRTAAGQLVAMLDCGKEMLRVAKDMRYSETLGKLELRIGLHVGPVAAGVLGVKHPRYCFYGSTQRLSMALTRSCPPMSLHVSEMVYNRIRGALGNEADYVAYTLSSFSGLGIIRTYLVRSDWLDTATLSNVNLPEYLAKIGSSETDSLQVMQNLVSSAPGAAGPSLASKPAVSGLGGMNVAPVGGLGLFAPLGAGAPQPSSSLNMMSLATQRYEAIMAGASAGVTSNGATAPSRIQSTMSTSNSAVPHTPTSLDQVPVTVTSPGGVNGTILSPTVSLVLAHDRSSMLSSATTSARGSAVNFPGLPVIRMNSGSSKTSHALDGHSRTDGEELDQVGELPRGETEHGGASNWGDDLDTALLHQLGMSQSSIADVRYSTATDADRLSMYSGTPLSPMVPIGGSVTPLTGSVTSSLHAVTSTSAAMAKLNDLVHQVAVAEVAANMHTRRPLRRDGSRASMCSTGTSCLSVPLSPKAEASNSKPAIPSSHTPTSTGASAASTPRSTAPPEPGTAHTFTLSAKCLARAKQAAAAQVAQHSANSNHEAAGTSAGGSEAVKPYETVEALMEALGTTYYTKGIVSKGITIAGLAGMNDDALRRAGIVTARARQQVIAELLRTKQFTGHS